MALQVQKEWSTQVGWAGKGVLCTGHARSHHFSGIPLGQRINEEGEAGMQARPGLQ